MTDFFDEHLTLDVIVAFADGEMAMLPFQRAAAHLSRCPRCSAEVEEQKLAQRWLRTAEAPRMPGSLLASLRSIPVAAPISNPPTSPGGPGSVSSSIAAAESGRHAGSVARSRRFRLGAGAVVAGIAVGAVLTAAAGEAPAPRQTVYDPLIAQINQSDDRVAPARNVQPIRFGSGK